MENYGYKPQPSQSQTSSRSAFWRNNCAMLFTTALTYKSVCKTYLIVSDSDKREDIVAVFADFLYNHFDDPGAVNDMWLNGPLSEFH